jgi:hypothetical protein
MCSLTNIPSIPPFQTVSGPVHTLPEDALPLDYFSRFWDRALFQSLLDQTNLYARQRQREKPDSKWYDTTPEEVKAFIGVNIIMAIHKKPAVYLYWSSDPFLGNPGIQAVFSRDRFEALTRYMHLNDSSLSQPRGHPHYDPLYRIRPLLQLCTHNFRHEVVPGQYLSLDEAMIKYMYKGRVFFR